MTWIKRSPRHCHSLHVGFPSATHPQQELRIFVATPPLAIQYLQREREGRQESPWGHCPVRGQTNTDQVPQKLSAVSTPNLRTETQAPHTQRQNLKTQEQEERDPKAVWPLCFLEQELTVPNCCKRHFPHLASTHSEKLIMHSFSSQFLMWLTGPFSHSKCLQRLDEYIQRFICLYTIEIQKPSSHQVPSSNLRLLGCFRLLVWNTAIQALSCPLTFSEESCLRVESLPRRLLALIPDSDVCIINCVARNCYREKKDSWPLRPDPGG